MNVCYVTTGYPAHKSSSRGIFIYRLIKSLIQLEDIHIDVIAPAPSKTAEHVSASLVYKNRVTLRWFRYMVPKPLQVLTDSTFLESLRTKRWSVILLPFFFLQFAITTLYYTRKSDVIHCFWTLSALFPVVFKVFHKTPIVLSVLGSDLAVIDTGFMRRINNYILKRIDQCIVLGKKQERYVRNRTNRVQIVPFGVDDELYYPVTDEEKWKLRKLLGLSPNRIYISYVGMFVPVKGLDLLIPVCQKLKEITTTDFQFLLIGDGDEKDRLFNRIKAESLEDYFLYVGNTPFQETPRWVRASDVSVSCSHSEGLNTALCEAVVSGLPVVGTRAGEIETIVENRGNGLIIENRSSEQFAESLKILMENAALRKKMGMKGSRRMKDFTTKVAAEKMLGIYKELIDETKPRSC